jgi:uncharacterized integral membrane protein
VSDDGERSAEHDHDRRRGPEAGGPGRSLAGRSTRWWVLAASSVLGLVLLIQNSTDADVHVLWFTIRMPLVFLLAVMVLVGAALDRAWLWRRRRR